MLEKILCVAEKEGWRVEENSGILLTSPMADARCEPQLIRIENDSAEVLYLDRVGEVRATRFALKHVHDTVKNTRHPLRVRDFLDAAANIRKVDKKFCDTRGLNYDVLLKRQAFGYLPSVRADLYSIKLFSLHPATIWGDAWAEAALKKWK